MTPQVHLNGQDRAEQTAPISPGTLAPMPATPAAAPAPTVPHELTDAERHGLAMGWVAIALGMVLLLGGLALWAAVAFSAGFGGWLIAMGLMGLVMVVIVVAVVYSVRPRR